MSNNANAKYIVVFKDGVSDEDIKKYAEQVNSQGGQVTNVYDTVLRGFAAEMPQEMLMEFKSLQGGIVDYIELDGMAYTQT